MTARYDNKILLVNWRGAAAPGATPGDLDGLIRAKMPNVAGVMLKISNGTHWQGEGDPDPKAITAVANILAWAAAFAAHNLDLHVWGVPRARRPGGAAPDLDGGAGKFIAAAS